MATAIYNQFGDTPMSSGGAPALMGPAGFWLDKDGNVAATDPSGQPQVTPGMRDNPQGAIYYDKSKDLNYNLVNGTKVYHSPVSQDANGKTIYKTSLKGDPISDTGGGLAHGRPQWNPQTGSWDVGLDWGKVLSWATAAGISAGVINAAMGPAAASSGLGPSTAANMSATTAASSSAPASLAAGANTVGSGAGVASVTDNFMRYGVPTIDNLVGGLIQSKASNAGAESYQKYLEDALAYQKEQDRLDRERQTKLDAENLAQQQYLNTTNTSRYNANVATEGSRYGDFTNNIAPFVASGQSANARMATLLGLDPAPYQLAPSSGRSSSTMGTGQNFDPDYIGQQLDAEYAKHGLTATGPGTGPTDKAYFIEAIRKNKGWDPAYWGPRITDELKKAGIADRPIATTMPTPATNPITTQPLPRTTLNQSDSPTITTQPEPRTSDTVLMEAPDGTQQAVSADQVEHYKQRGAKVIGAAA